MLLAIDVGNTNIVFAVFAKNNARPECVSRLETVRNRPAADYAGWMRQAGYGGRAIDRIIISSVVPPVNAPLKESCTALFSLEPVFVTYNMPSLNVPIDLARPQDMGADRLVNAVAVLKDYPCPAIVVDCGTATTFDVIDARGHFTGGVIAPGANLSMKALHLAAVMLPDVPVERPPAVIGIDTVSAMQSGIYWGYVGLIEKIVTGIVGEMGGKPLVIATGGLGRLFAAGTEMIDEIDPELTLRGLFYIDQRRVS